MMRQSREGTVEDEKVHKYMYSAFLIIINSSGAYVGKMIVCFELTINGKKIVTLLSSFN